MMALAWLIPVALFLGLLGLGAFLWALRSGQFEDLEGASWRAITDSERPGTQGDEALPHESEEQSFEWRKTGSA
jgi:cbb3-type cytochrome oxidase maturation protein